MGIMDAIRKTKVPTGKEVIAIPGQIRGTVRNQNLNTLNIRYFDRHCKHFIKSIGTIDHRTDIPVVYFDNPAKLGAIIFDDAVYHDEDNKPWMDVIEDYAYRLAYNTELQKFLAVEYLNDIANDRLDKEIAEKHFNETNCAYLIPLILNKIPREIIRINTGTVMISKDETYVNQKITVTAWLVRQWGNIVMYERTGKKDNSFIIFGIILGFLPGIIIGMIIYGSWLVKG